MGKRKQVGLFFSYSESWIAGSYYILNLVAALKLLPDDEMPHLTLIVQAPEDIESAGDIKYPYLEYQVIEDYNKRYFQRTLRVFVRKLFRKEIFKPTLQKKYPRKFFDAIFPAPILFNEWITKKVMYWIPDFQEEHLPQYFTKDDIELRKNRQRQIAATGHIAVFSSKDALNDFIKLYPENNVTRKVLNFAVIHTLKEGVNIGQLRVKYSLPDFYFFCPNQFWAHKNHKIVLEAITRLKRNYGKEIKVVFSGKEQDYRNPDFFKEIKKIIVDNDITNNVFILGFIDRSDQLEIMKNALAVIQPSLFEGWSTVVEDAKSMNQNLIVSAIAVHKEQLENMAVYFDPYNADSLVNAILNFRKTDVDFHYKQKQLDFATTFLSIVNE